MSCGWSNEDGASFNHQYNEDQMTKTNTTRINTTSIAEMLQRFLL